MAQRKPKPTDYSAVSDVLVPYRRASTREQAEKGTSFEGQRIIVEAGLLQRGQQALNWDCTDAESGSKPKREGLDQALAHVRAGEASGIIVAKQDRLSRGDMVDFGLLLRAATEEGWNIVCVDFGGLDLQTPIGQLISTILGAVNYYDLQMIRSRTKHALAVNKANGKRHGRPSETDPELLEAIVTKHLGGDSFVKIAADMTEAGALTAGGKSVWIRQSVRTLVNSQDGQSIMKRLMAESAA